MNPKKIRIKIGEREREYVTFMGTVTASRMKVKGREYVQYRLTVPKDVAEALAKELGLPPGSPVPVIVLMAPADPYHIIGLELLSEGRLEEVADERVREAVEELKALGVAG